MKIAFIITIILVLAYTILKNRRFDFFSIAVFSAFIYFFPGFLGVVQSQTGQISQINNGVYACYIIYLIMLQIMMLLADKYTITLKDRILYSPFDYNEYMQNNAFNNLAIIILELIGVIMLLYTVSYYGLGSGSFNKMQLLAEANKVTEYLKYIALFTFVYSFVANGQFIKLARVLSVILIGFTFLLGHRSFIVLGCIAIFMHFVESSKPVSVWQNIRKHKWAFLFIILAAIFFLFVKGVFAALMSGQYELVKSRLSNPEYYRDTFLQSEANSITLNLQNVISSKMSYSIGQYFLGFLGLVPFVGGRILTFFGYKSFETVLNERFNSQLSEGVGLGSTYLGEGYSMGLEFGVVFVLFIALILIMFNISKKNKTTSPFAYTFYGIMLTYLTFYIHRNSLIFLLISGRAYLYIWFLAFIIKDFLFEINPKAKNI